VKTADNARLIESLNTTQPAWTNRLDAESNQARGHSVRDTSPTSKAAKKGVVNAASQSDGADGSAESQQPSRQRRDSLGSMSEGIALVSLDCRIIGVNHCVGAILGLDSGAVLGRKYCELAQDESNTCENCPLDQIRSTGEPIETQCGLYSEDRIVAFHPVCDQAGRLAAYVLRS